MRQKVPHGKLPLPPGHRNYKSHTNYNRKDGRMTINFTFDNLAEMQTTIITLADYFWAGKRLEEIEGPLNPAHEQVKDEPVEKEPVKDEPVKEEPVKEEPKKEEAPKVDRVGMRKLLSSLNKYTGKNTARDLISEMGFKALTDVPDDRLPELKAKAEEVLNA